MAGLSVGLLLFPGFQVLDAAGPIDLLNSLSLNFDKALKLSVIAQSNDVVTPGDATGERDPFRSQQGYLPTHTIDNAPALDLLIVPGGKGTRSTEALKPSLEFIRKVYQGYEDKPPANYIFSVCTGSALLAMAGILDGQYATSNKKAWAWATSLTTKTHWVAQARWVNSGRIWTTSGISAGIDGMAALIAHIYGGDMAKQVCDHLEHVRITDPYNDPFAALYGCKDVLPAPSNDA